MIVLQMITLSKSGVHLTLHFYYHSRKITHIKNKLGNFFNLYFFFQTIAIKIAERIRDSPYDNNESMNYLTHFYLDGEQKNNHRQFFYNFFCNKVVTLFLLLSFTLLSTGCASTTPDGDVSDPMESLNRNIYAFNEGFDRLILKPVAEGYQKLPSPVQTGTHNFFSNLDDVVIIINGVLQLKLEQFSSDILRFSVNTTYGFLGLIDMGTPMGLPKHHASFADTLGFWGVGSGAYVVIPILGPSSVRDAPSLVVDYLLHPINQVSPASASFGLSAVRTVDMRAELLKTTEMRDELALDPYSFTRDSYYQWRQNRIYDDNPPPPKAIFDDFEDFEE